MSKRYGRNKRRQHREAIQALQEEIRQCREAFQQRCRLTSTNDSNQYQRKYEELCASIERLRELIGPDHIIWPPNSGKAYTAWGETFSMLPYRHRIDSSGRHDSLKSLAPNDLEMEVFLTKVDTDDVRDMVHMKVDCGNNRYGYAISRRSFLGTPPRALSRRIANQIALLLEQDITLYQKQKGLAPWRR